jgi:hypothetical protein
MLKSWLNVKEGKKVCTCRTAIGTFKTVKKATTHSHKLEELSSQHELHKVRLQVTDGTLGSCDFTLRQDCVKHHGINLKFSDETIDWDGCSVEMHQPSCWNDERMKESAGVIGEPDVAADLLDGNKSFLQQILDSECEKQDLFVASKAQGHLSSDQQ